MGKDARLLLVCPGIAKQRNLRRSGARNTVGSTLLLCNSEWLDGTIAGFCIAFAGSNTDVQPSGLLPILPETHEDHVCQSRCTRRHAPIAKMSRRMTLSQSTRNGFSGGYISKPHMVGHLDE